MKFDKVLSLLTIVFAVKGGVIPTQNINEIPNQNCEDTFKLIEKCLLLNTSEKNACEVFNSDECQQLYKNYESEIGACQDNDDSFIDAINKLNGLLDTLNHCESDFISAILTDEIVNPFIIAEMSDIDIVSDEEKAIENATESSEEKVNEETPTIEVEEAITTDNEEGPTDDLIDNYIEESDLEPTFTSIIEEYDDETIISSDEEKETTTTEVEEEVTQLLSDIFDELKVKLANLYVTENLTLESDEEPIDAPVVENSESIINSIEEEETTTITEVEEITTTVSEESDAELIIIEETTTTEIEEEPTEDPIISPFINNFVEESDVEPVLTSIAEKDKEETTTIEVEEEPTTSPVVVPTVEELDVEPIVNSVVEESDTKPTTNIPVVEESEDESFVAPIIGTDNSKFVKLEPSIALSAKPTIEKPKKRCIVKSFNH